MTAFEFFSSFGIGHCAMRRAARTSSAVRRVRRSKASNLSLAAMVAEVGGYLVLWHTLAHLILPYSAYYGNLASHYGGVLGAPV